MKRDVIAVVRGKRLPAPGDRITVATRHAPFGVARQRNARLVHRPARIVLVWSESSSDLRPRPWLIAGWLCGKESFAVTLHDEPPATYLPCQVCEDKYSNRGAGHVYYAHRDGRIKVGYSTDPVRRVRQLRAVLIATEPGSLRTERERHLTFAHLRVAGEWFHPGADLLEHIATLGRVAA